MNSDLQPAIYTNDAHPAASKNTNAKGEGNLQLWITSHELRCRLLWHEDIKPNPPRWQPGNSYFRHDYMLDDAPLSL